MTASDQSDPSSGALRPGALAWTALLGKWVELAQAGVAFPADAEGLAWRGSVPAVINLQAVTFALGEIELLDDDAWAYAVDRASVLIERSRRELADAWRHEGADMPASLRELEADADAALERIVASAVQELVWAGPGTMVMPALDVNVSAAGSFAVMMPGTIVMAGEPVAWWEGWEGGSDCAVPGCSPRRAMRPRQVYRVVEAGRMVRDVVGAIDLEPPAGAMPLLVPMVVNGHAVGRFTMDAAEWEQTQRAMFVADVLPVVTAPREPRSSP